MYPFAPEKRKINKDMISTFMSGQIAEQSFFSTNKLLLTQYDKTKYVLHAKILQFYLKHGMVLQNIHRGISFKQSDFFKPYIEENSQRRQSGNSFEKEFYKLLNNALFGYYIFYSQNKYYLKKCLFI